jgi:hypothetical protein
MDIQSRNKANTSPVLPRSGGNQNQQVRNAAEHLNNFSNGTKNPPHVQQGDNGRKDLLQSIMNLIQRLLAQFNKEPTPPNVQPVYGAIIPDEPPVQPVYGVILPGDPIGVQPVYGAIRTPAEQSGNKTI